MAKKRILLEDENEPVLNDNKEANLSKILNNTPTSKEKIVYSTIGVDKRLVKVIRGIVDYSNNKNGTKLQIKDFISSILVDGINTKMDKNIINALDVLGIDTSILKEYD